MPKLGRFKRLSLFKGRKWQIAWGGGDVGDGIGEWGLIIHVFLSY
jgi:hypothetical protein